MFLSWLPKKMQVARSGVYTDESTRAWGGDRGSGAVVRRVLKTRRLKKRHEEIQN